MTDTFLSQLAALPSPSGRRVALRVTPAAERAVRGGHPWLFAEAITRQSDNGRCGDLAVIFDRKGRFLAVGLYDPLSPIRVRILQHGEPAPINAAWLAARVAAAAQRRLPLHDAATSGYRLLHGANDGTAGLVVDRYGETAVLKLYTAAWLPHLRHACAALLAVRRWQRMVLRLSRHVAQQDDLLHGLKDGSVIDGPPLVGPVRFQENGLAFAADVVAGQKTGFFLDQRENRARVEALARGKTVLNVFAYTGGFSLYAARGGAARVLSQDMSQPALAAAQHNFALNQGVPGVAAAVHETLAGDAFAVLPQLRQAGERFDMVIIDPPSFASRQAQVERALAAYARLARLGLGVLRGGGTLVMASCSSRVTADDFFNTVHEAAAGVGRPLRELARTDHPLDHPITFREAAYLKCLFAVAP